MVTQTLSREQELTGNRVVSCLDYLMRQFMEPNQNSQQQVKQYGRYLLKNENNNVSKYFITFVMSISSQFNLFHINLQQILIIQYSEVKYYLFSITLGICFATVFNHCYCLLLLTNTFMFTNTTVLNLSIERNIY